MDYAVVIPFDVIGFLRLFFQYAGIKPAGEQGTQNAVNEPIPAGRILSAAFVGQRYPFCGKGHPAGWK